MTNFIIQNAPATYNTIFGWRLLNTFRAVISTYHVIVKFSATGKKIIVKGNLNKSWACYLKVIARSRKEDDLLQLEVMWTWIEILGEIEEVLTMQDNEQVLKISSTFCPTHKESLIQPLLDNLDIFA